MQHAGTGYFGAWKTNCRRRYWRRFLSKGDCGGCPQKSDCGGCRRKRYFGVFAQGSPWAIHARGACGGLSDEQAERLRELLGQEKSK